MTPFAGVDVAHLLASRALPPCCPGGRIMFKQTSSLQALALFTHSTKIRAVLLLPVLEDVPGGRDLWGSESC